MLLEVNSLYFSFPEFEETMIKSDATPKQNPSQNTEIKRRAARTSHAKAALKEAELRKRQIDQANDTSAKEKNGRGGLDPARFGDWEVKGIASDF